MPLILPILTAIGGAVITAFVQIYLGRRSKTGSIATSEAGEVWAAQKELTNELREELKRVKDAYNEELTEKETLREQTSNLRIEMYAVREEAEMTKNSMALVRKEAGTIRIHMMDLERQLEDCRKWLSHSTEEAP